MKKLFGILLSLLLITACRNEPSKLDKMLFILDYYNCVDFSEYEHYYNVDSILEQIDLSKYQHEDNIVRIHQRIPNSFLDSICTDEQLIDLVYDKNHSSAAKVTAFASLV